MKKIVLTPDAPAPIGPYSQAVEMGPFLFCSGQIPLDAKTGQAVTGSVAEQAAKVMENIKAVLNAGGCDFHDVIKTTIFLTNMNDFAAVNEVYAKYFTTEPPARSTVAVAGLPKGVNVEIEVLAYKK